MPEPSEEDNATRARIVRAAEKLFSEKGFHGTGMSDIERSVRLGRGAIYYHIGNKETLLFDITIRRIEKLNAYADEMLGLSIEPAAKARLLARAIVRDMAEHEHATRIFYREWQWLTGENRDRVVAAADRFEQAWKRILDEGAADGSLVARRRLTVKGVLGLFNSIYLWYDPAGPLGPDEIADELVELLLDGLRSVS
ncbi:TetR/AcrR family transcriptional regulator [Kribbella sp. NPDC051952]|uniref:TetR/AcrR family transcriptional regulator n=1 Tax=Kribbella sp. NPDC051952 TaxID=3154851 RepID=UPI00341265A6